MILTKLLESPLPVKMKVGRQIWCAETSSVGEISAGEPSGYKCRIGFEPDGRAFHDYLGKT